MSVFLKNLDLSKLKARKRPTSNVNRAQITPFPVKLYRMLEQVESEGREHIVSWNPDCCTFQVHNTAKFVKEVLPAHFKQTKYKSFQRQLNFYGFQRITSGLLEGSYGHPKFVKGKEELSKEIKRQVHHSDEARHNNKVTIVEPTKQDIPIDHYSVKPDVEMLSASEDESESSLDQDIVDAVFSPTQEDSLFSGPPLKRCGSTVEGTRMSFVGKKFFFLPVEFTDLYGED